MNIGMFIWELGFGKVKKIKENKIKDVIVIFFRFVRFSLWIGGKRNV